MGSSMTTEQKARNLERKLLSLSGLELEKNLHIEDIKIDFYGDNYIHTVKCGLENKEILVLIHGYGGSSVFFYQMLSELAKSFQVYCIDLLGMGLSSRPDFACQNTEETIDFFVDSIEKWRIEVGLEKFIICGHSFGGYMASQYVFKYIHNVSKMILLSPLGFTKKEADYNLEGEEYLGHLSFFQRQFYNLRSKFWRDKMTPSQLANKYVWVCGFLIRNWLTKRFKLSSDIGETLFDFLILTYKLPLSSEKAIHHIINPNVVAFHPLEDNINDLDLPICVFYGDKDWMDDSGAMRLYNKNKKNFEVTYIKDSGHQITMENPIELLNQMLKLHEVYSICT